jgi:hypothetical protein
MRRIWYPRGYHILHAGPILHVKSAPPRGVANFAYR